MPQPQSALRGMDQAYMMGIGQSAPQPNQQGYSTRANLLGGEPYQMPANPLGGNAGSLEQTQMQARLKNSTPVEQEVYRMTGMEPGLDRASILPIVGSRAEGNLGFGMPAMAYDAAKAFVSPGVAARGQQVSTDETVNTAMNFMGGSLARSHVAGPAAEAGTQMLGMAVKNKGGNWLANGVEKNLRWLKRGDYARDGGRHPLDQIRDIDERYTPEAMEALTPESRDQVNAARSQLGRHASLNNWIDTKLTKYIKNDMGTPEDPVRALAEQGILHVGDEGINYRLDSYGKYPYDGQEFLAKSDLAKVWEGASDNSISRDSALDLKGIGSGRVVDANPWLAKVPDDTAVYSSYEGMVEDLGFEHLVDELENSMTQGNPSGIPDYLLIDPNKLDRMTVPQVVQHVAKINRFRAENMSKANQEIAHNAATHIVKEYPETGLRWAQLKMPDGETNPVALQAALKYEGDAMGHCVGGYCDTVARDDTQIFSLRDEKGAPHVTIEVRPTSFDMAIHSLDDRTVNEMRKEATERMSLSGGRGTTSGFMKEIYLETYGELPSEIVQIKGKGNAKPADKYIPAVQDFIRTGKWSEVGDLENSGLNRMNRGALDWPEGTTGEQIRGLMGGDKMPNYGSFKASMKEALGEYYTKQDFDEWVRPILAQYK
jgi:hypothetical protein